MMKFHEFAEDETKMQIKEMKENSEKFSATLDDWTSAANCRFLSINLHFIDLEDDLSFINLGLLKIVERCNGEDTNFSNALEMGLTTRRDPALNTLLLYISNHGIFKDYHPLKLTNKTAAVTRT